jgi:hypothetical protein
MRCDERRVVALGRGECGERRRGWIAEAVREAAGCLVELVFIRRRAVLLRRRRHDAQRGGPDHLLGPEDAAVERAVADPATGEGESLGERGARDQVVVTTLQFTDAIQSGSAQLEITLVRHRQGVSGWCAPASMPFRFPRAR